MCGVDGSHTVRHLMPAIAELFSQREQTKSTEKVVRFVKLLAGRFAWTATRQNILSFFKSYIASFF